MANHNHHALLVQILLYGNANNANNANNVH